MASTAEVKLRELVARIADYDKENYEEICYLLMRAAEVITGSNRSRVYLEDLTSGSLVCAVACGLRSDRIPDFAFPLNTDEFLISRTYRTQEETAIADTSKLPNASTRDFTQRFAIRASQHFPLIHNGRSIGVLCVDSSRRGQLPSVDQRRQLTTFLGEVAPNIDLARRFHQQLLVARQIDEAKKKEAALVMMKSAVRLIDKLSLASILLPEITATGVQLRVLAAYSKGQDAHQLYDDRERLNLGAGESFLGRYIDKNGVIVDDRLLQPIYIPKIPPGELQKRYLVDELGLRSLYVVPFYRDQDRKVLCIVNYFSREIYHFNDFEKAMLEAHADMAQQVMFSIGDEHLEVQVLGEINDLLREKFDAVQPFLNRMLSKTTELIGADTGSVALVREHDGVRWLVVEDTDGKLLGAKRKEWLKKNIPPIRIGGEELPHSERSLTGYVAHTAKSRIVNDTHAEREKEHFYRELSEEIRSEMAVPIVFDDRVLAVICLDSLRPHYFTEEHVRILLIVAQIVGRTLASLSRIEELTNEVVSLRHDVDYKDPKVSSYKLGNIIGNSPRENEVVDFIQRVTPPLFNRIKYWSHGDLEESQLGLPSLLITGETGSGKEFLFNNIYSRLNQMYQENVAPRNELPLRKTNIAAFSGELTYSELFGHKRGAYTGAQTDRRGILEAANGGVVFLDEIGDADPKTQVQLLRFLDNGGFVRLGDDHTRYARVLLVAATNKDLQQLIREGTFREDLYHRLSELMITSPSLNERREDIPDLAVHFLGKLHRVYRRPEDQGVDAPILTEEAQGLLENHYYAGNVRELRSILLRALIFRRGAMIDAEDIRPLLIARDGGGYSAGTTENSVNHLARAAFVAATSAVGDFWSAIYQPFSEGRLPRAAVALTIRLAREQGAATMPKIALLLNACDPQSADPEERRRFFKFKNFLYKTIRIN